MCKLELILFPEGSEKPDEFVKAEDLPLLLKNFADSSKNALKSDSFLVCIPEGKIVPIWGITSRNPIIVTDPKELMSWLES